MREIMRFIDVMREEGTLVARMPQDTRAMTGKLLHEETGSDPVTVFVPIDDVNYAAGTWKHIRLACSNILRAQLQRPLPPAWHNVHESDLCDENGNPIETLPQAVRNHMAYTSISLRDPFLDAKVCVQQCPFWYWSFQ